LHRRFAAQGFSGHRDAGRVAPLALPQHLRSVPWLMRHNVDRCWGETCCGAVIVASRGRYAEPEAMPPPLRTFVARAQPAEASRPEGARPRAVRSVKSFNSPGSRRCVGIDRRAHTAACCAFFLTPGNGCPVFCSSVLIGSRLTTPTPTAPGGYRWRSALRRLSWSVARLNAARALAGVTAWPKA